jgi:hypothetical protein
MTIPNGLRPLTLEDKQSNAPYRVGALLEGTTIPQKKVRSFFFGDEYRFNQSVTEWSNDECAGCASALISGLQEGNPLSPHFTWMLARQRSNMRLNEYGVSLRDMAMAMRNYGSLRRGDSPLDFKDGRDRIATPAEWDIAELLKKSVHHKKGSILWVSGEGDMDAYDMFRSSVVALNAKYGKPHGVVFGMTWGYSLTDPNVAEVRESGVGHAVAIIDEWDGDWCTIVNSYGTDVGNHGEFRLHRDVFNRWADVYGAFIMIDETPEMLKWHIENGIKLDGNTYLNVLRSFVNALADLLAQLKKKVYGIFTR